MIYGHEKKIVQDPGHNQVLCSINDDQYKEIMLYININNHIEIQEDEDIVWKFKRNVAHEEPLNDSHPYYKWSNYNVMVEWETGETTTNPLCIITLYDRGMRDF